MDQGQAPRPSLSGRWNGTWHNSVGESGPDSLELQEDAQGNLSGTWSGSVAVTGRRTDASHLELHGRTSTREFNVQGVLEGGQLRLTYVARRLNAEGSYRGESRLTR